MTNAQWEILLKVVAGERVEPVPAGFIIDSPWLPNWAGMTIKEYFDDDRKWLDANLMVLREFPNTIFLPGFWSEFGMCTEPSAFGAKCVWHENELPFADKVINDISQIDGLEVPDPRRDGLCPAVIERLAKNRAAIEAEGHLIKFAVARGPLNIASFLMGNTEFLMAMAMNQDECLSLIDKVTDFTVQWLEYQKECFPTIEGIMILDDIVGFIGAPDFERFAMPSLKRIFSAFDADLRLFHNDAAGKVCAPYLTEIGVDIFNFAFDHSLPEMKEWTANKVALLGNIPPRDVLAAGTPDDVQAAVENALAAVEDHSRLILSCGGGMPPDVSSDNIRAFLAAIC